MHLRTLLLQSTENISQPGTPEQSVEHCLVKSFLFKFREFSTGLPKIKLLSPHVQPTSKICSYVDKLVHQLQWLKQSGSVVVHLVSVEHESQKLD